MFASYWLLIQCCLEKHSCSQISRRLQLFALLLTLSGHVTVSLPSMHLVIVEQQLFWPVRGQVDLMKCVLVQISAIMAVAEDASSVWLVMCFQTRAIYIIHWELGKCSYYFQALLETASVMCRWDLSDLICQFVCKHDLTNSMFSSVSRLCYSVKIISRSTRCMI